MVATAAVVQQILANAGGAVTALHELGAVETAAALWGRSLSLANVEPLSVRRVLTPPLLAQVGRELLLRGEFVGLLEARQSGLMVTPASSHTVTGSGPYESGWTYRLDLSGPSRTQSETVPAADVLHVRYGARTGTPWRGASPLASAGADVESLGWLLKRAAEQAKAPVGALFGLQGDLTSKQARKLGQTLAGTRGKSTGVGIGEATMAHTLRVGFDPSEQALRWTTALTTALWSACGFAPGLFAGDSQQASREAWRRWTLTVEHLGELVAAEATAKVEQPVALSFERLRSGFDSQTLGRAIKALTDAGVSLSDTLERVGLA